MIYNILAFLLMVGSLLVIIMIIIRKSPQVALIDVATIPAEQTEKKKRVIMEQRLERRVKLFFQKLHLRLSPVRVWWTHWWGRWLEWLKRIEDRSKQKQTELVRNNGAKRNERIAELWQQGEALLAEGAYEPAEQVFIELVSLDTRHVEAYKHLAEIYTALRQYGHAREVWVYVERLTGRDEAVLTNIGVLHGLEGKHDMAFEDFREALSFSPRSPRLLDLFLEECILAGKKDEAKDALRTLRSVNPDNQKLADFEKRILEL